MHGRCHPDAPDRLIAVIPSIADMLAARANNLSMVRDVADRLMKAPVPPGTNHDDALLLLTIGPVFGAIEELDARIGGESDEASCAFLLIAELLYRQLTQDSPRRPAPGPEEGAPTP